LSRRTKLMLTASTIWSLTSSLTCHPTNSLRPYSPSLTSSPVTIPLQTRA
jgi:hypothetical protein